MGPRLRAEGPLLSRSPPETPLQLTAERVSEIGLMRVLGATVRHVQRLFLLEAVILTVAGGAACGGEDRRIGVGLRGAVQASELPDSVRLSER